MRSNFYFLFFYYFVVLKKRRLEVHNRPAALDLEQVCDLILTGGTRLRCGGQRLAADETVTQMGEYLRRRRRRRTLLTLPPPESDDDDRVNNVFVSRVRKKGPKKTHAVCDGIVIPHPHTLDALPLPPHGTAVELRVAQPARDISHFDGVPVCQRRTRYFTAFSHTVRMILPVIETHDPVDHWPWPAAKGARHCPSRLPLTAPSSACAAIPLTESPPRDRDGKMVVSQREISTFPGSSVH